MMNFLESIIRFNEFCLESDEELRHREREAQHDEGGKQRFYAELHRHPDKLNHHLTKLSHDYMKAQKEHYDASDDWSAAGREHPYDIERQEASKKRLKNAAESFRTAEHSLHGAARHLNELNKARHHPGHYLLRGNVDPEEHIHSLARMHGLRHAEFYNARNRKRAFKAEQQQEHIPPFGFPGIANFQSHVHHHYGVMPRTTIHDGYRKRVSMQLPDKQKYESIYESDEDIRKAKRAIAADPSDEVAHQQIRKLRLRQGDFVAPRKQTSHTGQPFRHYTPWIETGLKSRVHNIEDRLHHYHNLDQLMSKYKMSTKEILNKHSNMPGTQDYNRKHSEKYMDMTPEQRKNIKDRLDFISRRAGARSHELYFRRHARDELGKGSIHHERERKLFRLGSHLIKKHPDLPQEMRERIWHLGSKASSRSRDLVKNQRLGTSHKVMYPPEKYSQEEPKEWRVATRGKLISKRS